MNSRLIIVGSSGYVAGVLRRKAQERKLAIACTSSSGAPDAWPLDLSQAELFDASRLQAGDTVALLAGLSKPDACEKAPDRCRLVNLRGTALLIEKVLGRGASVLFASSDMIYGERSQTAFEDAAPSPKGLYAECKARIERLFKEEAHFKTLRLSYVYSPTDSFTSYLRHCSQNRCKAEIFHPIYRRIIDINDVADAFLALSQDWNKLPIGQLNLSGPELLSRVDFAERYREAADPELEFEVIEPKPDFFESRPKVINMDSAYLEKIIGRPARDLRSAMQEDFIAPSRG